MNGIVEGSLLFCLRLCRGLWTRCGLPIRARHVEWSVLASVDDEISRPTPELINIAFKAMQEAARIDLDDVSARMGDRFPARYPDVWPGEHYKLLAALVATSHPRTVVEIGTAEGLSALAMLKFLPPEGQVLSYDVVPWETYNRSCLRADDFRGGRLRQILGDLSQPEVFARERETLRQADLIFLDGPKDRVFEPAVARLFEALDFHRPPLFVFDDIRLWNMLSFWRELEWPKLDLTSFGHWCGTGIALWKRK